MYLAVTVCVCVSASIKCVVWVGSHKGTEPCPHAQQSTSGLTGTSKSDEEAFMISMKCMCV